MGFSIRQKELYMMVLEKTKESGQIPLYAVTELMETNPEIFTGLKLRRVIRAVGEVEKFLAVEAMKNAAFGKEEEK